MKKLNNYYRIVLLTISFYIFLNVTNAQQYIIEANQSVTIACTGPAPPFNSEVEGTFYVDGEGYILVKHLGKVKASGKTPTSLGKNIAYRLVNEQIYRKCQISVTQGWSREGATILVTGQVNSPGDVQFKPGMTLTEAIAKAGGFNLFAKKHVSISRKGAKKPIEVKVKDIEKRKIKDIKLKPGDKIVAKKKFI